MTNSVKAKVETETEYKELIIVEIFILQIAKLRMLEPYYILSQNIVMQKNRNRRKWTQTLSI